MQDFFRECITEFFNEDLMFVTRADFAKNTVSGISLHRNEELDLIIELTCEGSVGNKREYFPAGTVRSSTDTIEFQHKAGWSGAAKGVVGPITWSGSIKNGNSETVETYTAQSVELDFETKAPPSYTVEWISNLSDQFIWPQPVSMNLVETFTKTMGSGDSEIVMKRSLNSMSGFRCLHLTISGTDLYLVPSSERSGKEKSAGQIIYASCPDQTFRDKVRTCLSFALGKQIVYLGHTDYNGDWNPTFMRSVDAFSIEGAAFKLPELPPYPITNQRYANIIDEKLISNVANMLFEKFDALKFNELSWSYWYAMAAPIHIAAVHFGAIIEQLIRNSSELIDGTYGKLLDGETWATLSGSMLKCLKTTSIDPDVQSILEGKISSLNLAPLNLVLKRLFGAMGLAISEVEMKAWRHRNAAAHGGFSDKPVELILNSKVLRLLFHRILAGVSGCSNRYIDYYNLGFPVRSLAESVPTR